MVPEPDVLDGGPVILNVLGRQIVRHVEVDLVHALQRVRFVGRRDVVLDVRALLVELVRYHHQLLHERGICRPAQEGEDQQDAQRVARHLERAALDAGDDDDTGERRRDHQQREHRQPRVDVGVARSAGEDVRARGEQQVELVEPVAEDLDEQRQAEQPQAVCPRPRDRLHRVADDTDGLLVEVKQHADHEGDHYRVVDRLPEVLNEPEAEDVEADVLAEDGVGLAEGDGVLELEPGVPLPAGDDTGHHRAHEGEEQQGPIGVLLDLLALLIRQQPAADEGHVIGQGPARQAHVRQQPDEEDDPHDRRQLHLRPEYLREDLALFHRSEPQIVGVQGQRFENQHAQKQRAEDIPHPAT